PILTLRFCMLFPSAGPGLGCPRRPAGLAARHARRPRHKLRTNRLASALPEEHSRIGPPGAPRFRPALEFPGGTIAECAAKNEITGGKRVRIAQRTHGHVLGGPFSDAGNFTEPRPK